MIEDEHDPCPALVDLLLAVDEDLPPQAQASTSSHLQRCPECQARIAQMSAVLREFQQVDTSGRGRSPESGRPQNRDESIAYIGVHLLLRRWVPAVVLVAFAFVIARWSGGTRVEAADQVLDQAVARARLGAPAAVQVRYWPKSLAQSDVSGLQPFTFLVNLTDRTQPPEQISPHQRILARYGFHWRDPLDVSAYRRWRASVNGRDSLVTHPDQRQIVLRTVVDDGELRSVEVSIQSDTYRVVSETLEFQSLGQLKIEDPTLVAGDAAPLRASVSPGKTSPEIPVGGALDLSELRARLILAEADPDNRGNFRVIRSNGVVRVSGIVPNARFDSKIRAQLAELPNVNLTLRHPSGSSGLSRWAEPPIELKRDRVAFVPTLARQIAAVRRRLETLHNLAARYSDTDVKALSPQASDTFQRLIDLHFRALGGEAQQLNVSMATISGTSHRGSAVLHAPVDWRFRIAAALSRVMTFDALSRDLLIRDDLGEPESHRLAEHFDAFWNALHQ